MMMTLGGLVVGEVCAEPTTVFVGPAPGTTITAAAIMSSRRILVLSQYFTFTGSG
jgi:hypothetical protein